MPIRHEKKTASPEHIEDPGTDGMRLVPDAGAPGVRRSSLSPTPGQCVEITLRPYTSGDLNAMTALDAVCFSKDFLFGETLMAVLAENAYAFTLVADAPGGEMAGFAIAHRRQEENPDAAYLVTMDVNPQLRRCGIGSGLLRAIERLLVESEVYFLELHVHTGNAAALRFYEEHGFSRVARIPSFYGVVDRDAFLYSKRLGTYVATTPRSRR